jgi:response regulator RpfG family c-di-GMP phosphodiesterase
MAEHPVDVIISDMRMPGMDGATLLALVQERFPHAIRIMLTGQEDEESILRTVGVVHQFITKPSDPETLSKVLERACVIQDLMKNEQLKSLVSSLGKLPSLPTVYAQLQRKLKEPDCAPSNTGEFFLFRIFQKHRQSDRGRQSPGVGYGESPGFERRDFFRAQT